MCGIAGCRESGGGDLRPLVVRQLRTLDHRGPDSWGSYDAPGCSIGQTRLAVIDLDTGDPPLTSEDGRTGVVLNGEIYGFARLREELLGQGHTFRSRGDTEVIAHLSEDLEPAAVAARLDGMFAYAVHDRLRDRLVLGRDRLGKKPLFYWHDGGTFVFGSEIKALLAHPAVPRTVDDDAVRAYLAMGHVPSPRTIWSGIRSVPPGHVLVLEADEAPRLERYWSLPGATARHEAPRLADAAREVRRTLSDAVARRLVADVPVGAFLSGGIDSSAVVALMAERSGAQVRTFTIGFEDDEHDERRYAAAVARRYGTEHHEFVVRPDAVELVERLVEHHDQPFGDATSLPTYLLAELTRKHVTVALTGDGGDEAFAGYERFGAAAALARAGRVPGLGSLLRRAGGSRLAGGPGGLVARTGRRIATPLPEGLRTWLTYFTDEELVALGSAPSGWPAAAYRAAWTESAGAPLLQRLLELNIRTYLLDDLLPKADRMTMAHGLEVRSPFLDVAVVEQALRLPSRHLSLGPARKRVLRAAVADLLPAEVMARRKQGFGLPLDRWFRTELAPLAEDRLLGPGARVTDHLSPDGLRGLWEDHQAGASRGFQLWLLLSLETFLRRYA